MNKGNTRRKEPVSRTVIRTLLIAVPILLAASCNSTPEAGQPQPIPGDEKRIAALEMRLEVLELDNLALAFQEQAERERIQVMEEELEKLQAQPPPDRETAQPGRPPCRLHWENDRVMLRNHTDGKQISLITFQKLMTVHSLIHRKPGTGTVPQHPGDDDDTWPGAHGGAPVPNGYGAEKP